MWLLPRPACSVAALASQPRRKESVTTQGWPNRGPAHEAHSRSSRAKHLKQAAAHDGDRTENIQNQRSGFIPFLRRSSQRTIPASRRPSSRRRHPVRELTSRWWLTGGYGPLQWYQSLIGPRLWAATISLVWRCYYGDGGLPEKIQPADPIPSLPHSRIERRQLSPGANRPAARRRPRAPSAASVGGAQIRRALT
jgi:hypothetical protein